MQRTLALAATVLAAACADSQQVIDGSFRLRGSTSDTVPFIAQRDQMCTHWVQSGSAEFRKDGTYTSSFPMTHDCPINEGKIAIDTFGVKKGTYRMVSDTIILYNDAGKLSGYAHMKGDTMLVRGPGHVLVFVRR